jgi:isopentenyl phosphate kinase
MKYVIKVGGAAGTHKDYKFAENLENKPQELLDFIQKNRKILINYENLKSIVPKIVELGEKNTVYSIWGPGSMGHPLAIATGYGKKKINEMDISIINCGVLAYIYEVSNIAFDINKNTEIFAINLATFMDYMKRPDYLKTDKNRLYIMCSYFNKNAEPVSSDDIFKFLVEEIKPDYCIMISKDGLYNKPPHLTNAKKLKGEFTLDQLKEVESCKVKDVTGGMTKKLEVILDLVNKDHIIHLLTPEEFCNNDWKLKIVP